MLTVSFLCTAFVSLRTAGILKVEDDYKTLDKDLIAELKVVKNNDTTTLLPCAIVERDSISFEKKLQKISKVKGKLPNYSVLYEEPSIERFDSYKKTEKEWSGFTRSIWNYKYGSMKYTERELMALTNVIYRESTSSNTPNKSIDQYLVMITAIRVVQNKKRGKVNIADMLSSGGTFTYITERFYTVPTFEIEKSSIPIKKRKELWLRCKRVALDVINCSIPEYVPYLPHGTFYYHNSRLDKNIRQRKHIEKTSWCIAASVKDHHYYVQIKYSTPAEIKYIVENKIESPISTYPRKISTGNKKLLLSEYSKYF
jgi:hypothetical protein